MRALCTTIGLTALAAAAAGGGEWIRTIGIDGSEDISSVQATRDGGNIVAGVTSGSEPNHDAWVAKLDALGKIMWQKTYGGAKSDLVNSIRRSRGGGYVAVGESYSFRAQGRDIWVIRLDSDGDIKWQRVLSLGPFEGANDVLCMKDGDLVVGTSLTAGKAQSMEGWVMKLDREGKVLWWRRYGGSGWDGLDSIVRNPRGGCVVAGETSSYGHGYSDVWVLALDRLGKIVWQRTIGGSKNDWAKALIRCRDGSYVLSGSTMDPDGIHAKPWAVKLDASGNVLWERVFSQGFFVSVHESPAGGYVFAGQIGAYPDQDVWLLKLDSNGAVEWQKRYGGVSLDWPHALAVAADGTWLVGGQTNSFRGGDWSAFLLRVSPTGDLPPTCAAYVEDADATVLDFQHTAHDSSAVPIEVDLKGAPATGVVRTFRGYDVLVCGAQQ